MMIAVYKKFLGGEGDQMPELVVELVPGEIGKHYHWYACSLVGFDIMI